MDEQELIDLDEELDEEQDEADSVSVQEGFINHMEGTLNEDVLAQQGVTFQGNKFKFTGFDGKEYELTFKQKLFCEKYLEFRGFGVNAVIAAGYDVRKKDNEGEPINNVYNRKLAKVIASENLTKPNLCAYIQVLYDRYGFNDEAVEREHLYLINQHTDLKTKKAAIDMFYNLKNRYPAKKVDLSSMGEKILGINMVVPDGTAVTPVENGDSDTKPE